jgi:hypothetical protein
MGVCGYPARPLCRGGLTFPATARPDFSRPGCRRRRRRPAPVACQGRGTRAGQTRLARSLAGRASGPCARQNGGPRRPGARRSAPMTKAATRSVIVAGAQETRPATSESGSSRRPVTATPAPAEAYVSAIAAPIPVPPPVTRATFPRKRDHVLIVARPPRTIPRRVIFIVNHLSYGRLGSDRLLNTPPSITYLIFISNVLSSNRRLLTQQYVWFTTIKRMAGIRWPYLMDSISFRVSTGPPAAASYKCRQIWVVRYVTAVHRVYDDLRRQPYQREEKLCDLPRK